jgi:hypothetical protein
MTKAAAQAEVAVAPPRTLAPEVEGRGGGRSRAAIGESRCEAGFHEASYGGDESLFTGLEALPNRRRPRESPRGTSQQGDGARLTPQAATRRAPDQASAWRRGPGERQGLRAAPRSDGRPEGPRPRCEPQETARLRPGRIRQREAMAGFRPCRSDPTGIGEGPSGLSRDPPGPERGFAASLRDPGKAAGAQAPPQSRSRPARDGLATQRRQSRLGQVGAGGDTGPHYRFRPPSVRAGASRASPPRRRPFFERRHEGTKARS